ncbi:MAG: hypothetical protein Q8916_02425 [Bacteroidota bacterium]|nr:hypothetical protein [Bacteroidota bacterium]MDP4229242.1 hypothetical protein [Bacteroidota bacterium]MDP4235542.1 hypothetical protein [Bacteroidota bacterium]
MKIRFVILLALCYSSPLLAQHMLQLDDGTGNYSIIKWSTSGGTYTLPTGGGTFLTQLFGQPTVSSAWLLGGNTSSSPNNKIGTLDATSLIFVTGTGGPNTRMTITSTGDVGIGATNQFLVTGSNGNLGTIRGINYTWPTAHTSGFLKNDGAGGLSWATSTFADKAGLGTWTISSVGTNKTNIIIPVAGSTVTKIIPPFAGSITGLSVVMSAPCGGGTLTAEVWVNNNPTGLTVTINGTEEFDFTSQAAGLTPISAGDQIQIHYTTVGYNGGNDDMLATVFAQF